MEMLRMLTGNRRMINIKVEENVKYGMITSGKILVRTWISRLSDNWHEPSMDGEKQSVMKVRRNGQQE